MSEFWLEPGDIITESDEDGPVFLVVRILHMTSDHSGFMFESLTQSGRNECHFARCDPKRSYWRKLVPR